MHLIKPSSFWLNGQTSEKIFLGKRRCKNKALRKKSPATVIFILWQRKSIKIKVLRKLLYRIKHLVEVFFLKVLLDKVKLESNGFQIFFSFDILINLTTNVLNAYLNQISKKMTIKFPQPCEFNIRNFLICGQLKKNRLIQTSN